MKMRAPLAMFTTHTYSHPTSTRAAVSRALCVGVLLLAASCDSSEPPLQAVADSTDEIQPRPVPDPDGPAPTASGIGEVTAEEDTGDPDIVVIEVPSAGGLPQPESLSSIVLPISTMSVEGDWLPADVDVLGVLTSVDGSGTPIGPIGLAASPEHVWVLNPAAGDVVRVAPDGTHQAYDLPLEPLDALTMQAIAVADTDDRVFIAWDQRVAAFAIDGGDATLDWVTDVAGLVPWSLRYVDGQLVGHLRSSSNQVSFDPESGAISGGGRDGQFHVTVDTRTGEALVAVFDGERLVLQYRLTSPTPFWSATALGYEPASQTVTLLLTDVQPEGASTNARDAARLVRFNTSGLVSAATVPTVAVHPLLTAPMAQRDGELVVLTTETTDKAALNSYCIIPADICS